jgi:hypothetical protein
MPNIAETIRQQAEGFIPIQASAAIQAGGPGSGRHAEGNDRPKWKSNSKNHDLLDKMHDKLIKQGYQSHGFTQRNNYNSNKQEQNKDREHNYSKTNANGEYRGASIYEKTNGQHSLSNTVGPGGKWAKEQVAYDHATSNRKY